MSKEAKQSRKRERRSLSRGSTPSDKRPGRFAIVNSAKGGTNEKLSGQREQSEQPAMQSFQS
jgi:hypothetical protein